MHLFSRRATLLAVTALVGGVMAMLPQAGQADGSSMTVTVTGTTGGGKLSPFTIPAGGFSKQLPLGPLSEQTGTNAICAYLEIPSTDPHAPGPLYSTPAAFATATWLGGTPCADLDSSFSITHLSTKTWWDSVSAVTNMTADLTVTTKSLGSVTLLGQYPAYNGTLQGGAVDLAFEGAGAKLPLLTPVEYKVYFYPGWFRSPDGSDSTMTCTQSDGTSIPVGPSSSFAPPPKTVTITWFPGGQGGTASVDGAIVPGSTTYTPVNHTPTITGATHVGGTAVCGGVTAEHSTAWLADGRALTDSNAGHPTYTIPGNLYGKSLTCGTFNRGLAGWPLVTTKPVTVGIGTLSMVAAPHVAPYNYAGVNTFVYTGKWKTVGLSEELKYAYQWFVAGKPVSGATHQQFQIPKADAGKSLACRVTARSPGYKSIKAMTKPVTIKSH
jgi:hypothetical protein